MVQFAEAPACLNDARFSQIRPEGKTNLKALKNSQTAHCSCLHLVHFSTCSLIGYLHP